MSEARANAGNYLLVDFIDRSRVQRSSDTDEEGASSTTTTVKQVSFSRDKHKIRWFQYPSIEEISLSRRWDSERDKYLFRQEYGRDVHYIRRLLSTTPMESLEEEVLYFCVGLEPVITIEVARYLKNKKRNHSRSIVAMQDRLSDKQLAEYAMNSSSESRERAQKVASGYWVILSRME